MPQYIDYKFLIYILH